MAPQRGVGLGGPRPASLPLALYIAGLALIAALGAWAGWLWLGNEFTIDLSLLLPLVILGAAGVVLRERGLGPHLGVSVAAVVLAAAIPLAGPVGAAIVGLLSYLADFRQRRWRGLFFNAAMSAAVGAIGGLSYVLFGGLIAPGPGTSARGLILQVGLPLVCAYLVMTAVNVLAIAGMSTLVRGTRLMPMSISALRSLGWGYLSHVVIGFLFVILWGPVNLGSFSAIFVLGPLLVAHWTIGREGQARREHQETVTTFVAALEQADPASAGHSARVAALADAMAGPLGIRGSAAEELRYAALLHDIGLVAVRSEVSASFESDPVSYLTSISVHPQAAVSVLSGIDFLKGALPAIAYHHERLDGRGYPAGVPEQEIPLAARVIAVADAYDALTHARGSHTLSPSDAIGVLRGRVGTHLDGTVVEVLAEAVERGLINAHVQAGDPSSADPGPGGSGMLTVSLSDHDDPSIGDAFANWQPDQDGEIW